MISTLKHAFLLTVAMILTFAILPTLGYEMDYFPKFSAKKRFYVQTGSVSPNMDDVFFKEMEERLDATCSKYDKNFYFLCVNSDETDPARIETSAVNYANLLWREWSRQGMPSANTVLVVLAGNQAQDLKNSKFRASGRYDSDTITLPVMRSNTGSWQQSITSYLVDRNCPHQFVRAIILTLDDESAAEAADKKARAEAAAKAAEAAKIDAARKSDHPPANRFSTVISGIETMQRDFKHQQETDYRLFVTCCGLMACAALFGGLLHLRKKH